MELKEILKIDPKNNIKIRHFMVEDWTGCFFQYKKDTSLIEKKEVWKKKYNENGWGDLSNDNEGVFDPNKKVHEGDLETTHTRTYSSMTFIELLQKRILQYIKNEEDEGMEWKEDDIGLLCENFGVSEDSYYLENLFIEIGCEDYKLENEEEDESILWYSYYEREGERHYIDIEEDLGFEEGYNKIFNSVSGLQRCEGNIKKGKEEGFWKYFHQNGKIECEGNYIEGKREGLWKSFSENGQLYIEENYIEGKLEGLWKSFYENGQLNEEGNYIEGKLEGLWKSFYENGQLKEEGNYIKYEKEGLWKTFHENGQLKTEGGYKDSVGVGVEKEFDESGKIISEYDWGD